MKVFQPLCSTNYQLKYYLLTSKIINIRKKLKKKILTENNGFISMLALIILRQRNRVRRIKGKNLYMKKDIS